MKQRPSSIFKLFMSAVVLTALLALSGPVGNILSAYSEPVPSVWRIVSRLVMLLSGLALASALIQLLLERRTPFSTFIWASSLNSTTTTSFTGKGHTSNMAAGEITQRSSSAWNGA